MTRTSSFHTFFMLCLLSFPIVTCLASESAQVRSQTDILVVSGTITNEQGKPVKEAALHFFLNDKRLELEPEVITSPAGRYEAEIRVPAASLPRAGIALEVTKPSFKSSGRVKLEHVVEEKTDGQGNHHFLAHHGLVLERAVTPAFWIATLILIGVYALIAFELLHRTLAAFLGASLMLTLSYTAGTFFPEYFILSYEDAVQAIDMNVIFLLMGMMMIVGILKKTGLFQWMAYKSFQLARGNIFALSTILMVVTAVASAFLDNVTTMLLIIPVTIEIALTLRINPVALLMPEVFASNVGGTATLIGDPPNIMIGSYAKLSFLDFVQNLSVVCAIGMVITVAYFLFWYRKEYATARVGDVQGTIDRLREEYKITNKTLLIQGFVLLGITVFLFIMHGALKMEPSIAAMFGAAVLMVISRVDIVEMLEKEVEWPTLIFFMMLFVIVAGAEETGVIQTVADWVRDMSQGSMVVAVLMVLWVAAVASAIVDNIPFTATMLPVVSYLTGALPGAESGILWWALALGACLGGNGTMIGASANVVTVGMAERAGHPISFMAYVKVAVIPTFITIVLASAWMLFVW